MSIDYVLKGLQNIKEYANPKWYSYWHKGSKNQNVLDKRMALFCCFVGLNPNAYRLSALSKGEPLYEEWTQILKAISFMFAFHFVSDFKHYQCEEILAISFEFLWTRHFRKFYQNITKKISRRIQKSDASKLGYFYNTYMFM